MIATAAFSTSSAQQLVSAAQSGLSAREQQSAFEAAAGYFDLLRATAVAGGLHEAERIAMDYAQQVAHAADAGIAFRGDASRATVQVERTRLDLRRAEEQTSLASAHLAQVLLLDPVVQLQPVTAELAPLVLADTNATLDSLVARALAGRPEFQKSAAELKAPRKLKDGAVYGPLIPTVGASVGYGGLGGGPGNPWPAEFGSSRDYFVGLGWRLGPGGLFDRSRIRASSAQVRTSELQAEQTRDQIVGEVVSAQTRSRSLADQIETARRALVAAEETARLTRERKSFGVGVVSEDILAQQDLARAQEAYLSAVADFNKVQFGLQRAVGGNLVAPRETGSPPSAAAVPAREAAK